MYCYRDTHASELCVVTDLYKFCYLMSCLASRANALLIHLLILVLVLYRSFAFLFACLLNFITYFLFCCLFFPFLFTFRLSYF